jgi:transcriptional regulator with XRE-family HTH domain
MEKKILMIAERIQALREIMDKTVKDLADSVGLSEDQYMEYERGEHDFTFSFLYSVSNKLGVDIVDLMTGETPRLNVCSFVKNGEGLHMERRKEYQYEHLAFFFRNKKMEPFFVTVEPKDTDARDHLNAHEGQEFDYILEGSMKLHLDKQELLLNKGDAVYFDAKHPHAMEAMDGVCKFLAIIAK